MVKKIIYRPPGSGPNCDLCAPPRNVLITQHMTSLCNKSDPTASRPRLYSQPRISFKRYEDQPAASCPFGCWQIKGMSIQKNKLT